MRNREDYIIPIVLLVLIVLAAAIVAVFIVAPATVARAEVNDPLPDQMVVVTSYEQDGARYVVLAADSNKRLNLSPLN